MLNQSQLPVPPPRLIFNQNQIIRNLHHQRIRIQGCQCHIVDYSPLQFVVNLRTPVTNVPTRTPNHLETFDVGKWRTFLMEIKIPFKNLISVSNKQIYICKQHKCWVQTNLTSGVWGKLEGVNNSQSREVGRCIWFLSNPSIFGSDSKINPCWLDSMRTISHWCCSRHIETLRARLKFELESSWAPLDLAMNWYHFFGLSTTIVVWYCLLRSSPHEFVFGSTSNWLGLDKNYI